MPELSIIIPTYNRAEELRRAIETTITQTFRDWEMFIIDNGPSTDDTGIIADEFARQDPRINYISTEIKGIIYAKIMGAGLAKGKILLTLDDDIEFIDKGSLEKMMEIFRNDDKVGVVGGLELRSPGQIVPPGPERLPLDTGRISIDGEVNTAFGLIEGHGVSETDHVRGAFMGIRKGAFDLAGGYESIYFAGGRAFRYETDLCMRIKNCGYKVFVNPDIKIWHKAAEHMRGFKRGRGLEYMYFANRNHAFFMRRFFWKSDVAGHILKDIVTGTNAAPGIIKCINNMFKEKDIAWLGFLFASFAGKISGNIRFVRYGIKKNTDNL